MQPATDCLHLEPTPRTSLALGRILALTLSIGLLTTSALAGADEPMKQAPEQAEPVTTGAEETNRGLEFSPYELARLIRDRMMAYTHAPKATNQETAVRSAWRNALSARAGRMLARMERVVDSRGWNVRAATTADWAPRSASTARLLRDLAHLYVDLSASEQSIAKARIVLRKTQYFGHVPARVGKRPTQEAEIKGVRHDRKRAMAFMLTPGGGALIFQQQTQQSVQRVKVKIYDREVAQRLRLAKQARIDSQVALIRARIDAYTDSLKQDLELVRILTASLQLREEMRLARELTQLTDDEQRESAQRLLDEMKVSRNDARRRMFKHAAGFGSSLRRGWLQKRSRLERALKRRGRSAE